MITQKYNINLIPTGEIIVIHVNQADTGNGRLVFNLKLNGEDYTPTGTVKIQGIASGEFEHACSVSGSVVTSDLYEDMTDKPGDIKAQLVNYDGDNRTGSQIFILRVQRSA